MIYQQITWKEFRDAFTDAGRRDQFSYKALRAIFDYEDELDYQVLLDPIGTCCTYTEYLDSDAVKNDYPDCPQGHSATIDWLNNQTMVIASEPDCIVIEQF